MRDLGRWPGSSMRTDEWRLISWYCGDAVADQVCAWASGREDGEERLAVVYGALLLMDGSFGARGARQAVAHLIGEVDPGFVLTEPHRVNYDE